eukprot:CAMPEP_0198225656 /NCGR_PEP_ID=MMETSP1445-20131203/102035_1 /TAXON_ID=36898 /ORGANISM="Pyramimonas sp., Strain CCMP2087" /LENGTH=168 /DNA_ID=CAMNT_0043905245 /DNA_START=156 /DNA_END=662 /DNA_ORIENTATION=-
MTAKASSTAIRIVFDLSVYLRRDGPRDVLSIPDGEISENLIREQLELLEEAYGSSRLQRLVFYKASSFALAYYSTYDGALETNHYLDQARRDRQLTLPIVEHAVVSRQQPSDPKLAAPPRVKALEEAKGILEERINSLRSSLGNPSGVVETPPEIASGSSFVPVFPGE